MTQFSNPVSLKAKHAALESQIRDEETRVRPDGLMVRALKRQKLKIKDRLNQLVAQRHRPMASSSAQA
jgi:hypothetical protein